MNEDFVTFELAKKLKEKGFPQDITEKSYFVGDNEKRECRIGDFVHHPVENKKHLIAAPTISQVEKWLREEYRIHIYSDIYHRAGWLFGITCLRTGVHLDIDHEENLKNSYPSSMLAGIECVLDNLI